MIVRLKKAVYIVCDRMSIIKPGELMEIASLKPLTRKKSNINLSKQNVKHLHSIFLATVSNNHENTKAWGIVF